jgi:hypothetical protein
MGSLALTWTLDPGAHGVTNLQFSQDVLSTSPLHAKLQGLRSFANLSSKPMIRSSCKVTMVCASGIAPLWVVESSLLQVSPLSNRQ